MAHLKGCCYLRIRKVLHFSSPFAPTARPHALNNYSVEDPAFGWFKKLGYAVRHGTPIAPGNPTAGCEALGEGELEE